MIAVSSHAFHDAVIAVPWSLANVLLVCAAWRLRESMLPEALKASRILDVAVIYCAAIVLTLTTLGSVGLFSGIAMLVGVGLVATGGLVLARWLSAGTSLTPERPTVATSDTVSRLFSTIWLILFGLLCGHVVVDGLLRFPTDFDSLMYHMPLIDHWLQAGKLYAPDSASWWSPGNSELIAAWMTGPFSGDFLVALNNVPVVIVWAAAALEVARRLGMTGVWPHLAAIATLSVHTLLHETDDASNDLMVGAFGLAAAAYTLRYFASFRRVDLILFGVSIGLLAGVKYFALGYAVVCVAALGLGLVLCRGWGSTFKSALVASLAAIPFGGYWYVRNVAVTGFPLYPMGVREATANLGYPDIWSTSFVGNGHPQLLELGMAAVWRMCGPIHYVAVAAAPVVVIWLLGYSLRRRFAGAEHSIEALKALALAVWLVGSGTILLMTPFSVEDQPGTLNHLRWAYTPTRYGLCFLSFSVLAFFLALAWASRSWGIWFERVTATAMAAVCAWQIVQRVWTPSVEFDVVTVVLLGVNASLLAIIASNLPGQSVVVQRIRWGVLIVAVVAVSFGAAFLSERWHQGYADHFDQIFHSTIFARIEKEYPFGAYVVVFDPRPYAFFGSARQHTVIDPRFFVSREWLDGLGRQRKPDILAVGQIGDGFNRYRGTLEGVSGHSGYTPTKAGGHFHIFVPSADSGDKTHGDKTASQHPADRR